MVAKDRAENGIVRLGFKEDILRYLLSEGGVRRRALDVCRLRCGCLQKARAEAAQVRLQCRFVLQSHLPSKALERTQDDVQSVA